ncbi:PREDICTED: disease resistance protein At4g27190-like [Nicotiana attenuata]|uniref:Disease resistance protein n=1 Tax=Nicotiana attenuata TaxID=49451 RepID=A0A1J6J1W2_NICAT|nr:PREDICTED: disease resistance protein At4g27190-like [Nicotiana attenuata]OIT03879.1 disease resistance protein [Nicotiana attenuata]
MEIIFNAVAGFVVEVGKLVCKCIYPKIENTVRFTSNVQSVREEMEKLTKFRDISKGRWKELREKAINQNQMFSSGSNMFKTWRLTGNLCNKTFRWLHINVVQIAVFARKSPLKHESCEINFATLKKMGQNFGSSLVVENYQVKKVEYIPGPSIEGQSTATRNLNKILQLLEDDKVGIIGVWGMGGIGKTTLVKNLNNELLKTAASSSKLSFSVVVWVTVPKPPIDIRKVQAQIANRFNLKVDTEESVERIASRIHQRLREEKSFLLILDDVWQAISLDHVGVPQPEDPARSKVILTCRFVDVCRQMKTDTEMKVLTFDEDESWQMFVKNAGDIANLEHIQPVAKEIARECNGLPLAITVI